MPTNYFWDGEIDCLIHLIRSVNPRAVAEFGANSGRTAKAVLSHVPSLVRYYGIEVPANHVASLQVQQREVPAYPGQLAFDDDRFRLIVHGKGSRGLTLVDFPVWIDAVFIDGDHSAEGVLHDYRLAKLITRPGGIIIFHDDNGRATVHVTQVLDALARQGAPIIHINGTWLAYERIQGKSA